MKIALVGSAPSSVQLAPFADPLWQIWGCSPGAYIHCARAEVWFELHRWQPPVIGRADKQVAWLSPEYCAWMAMRPRVYMIAAVPEIPNSVTLPVNDLVAVFGNYNFTSSLAWMMAMAIMAIRDEGGPPGESAIGLWGVDMAADEEYGYQRAGCQFFIQWAIAAGISLHLPPESDLMCPPPLYGVVEATPAHVKSMAREVELKGRLARAQQQVAASTSESAFLQGALSDLEYNRRTWIGPSGVLAKLASATPRTAPVLVESVAGDTKAT